MAERPKGISQEAAEVYALLGVPYEGYVEGVGYQSQMAFTMGSCYFQERGCAIPQFVPVMDSSPEMRIHSIGGKHLVTAGETLTSISQYYGATIASIMAANPGIDWLNARNNGDLIFVGEELALPKGGQDDLLPTDPSASTCMFQFSAANEVKGMMAAGSNSSGSTSYGLYVAASAGSAWDVYNNFAYNHTSYPTTKGIMKPYSDFAGRNMSKQALKFKSFSRVVKWIGNFGTGLMVFQSSYNYYHGDRSAFNFIDGGVGLFGLGNAASLQWAGYGSAAVGPLVAWYGSLRLMIEASSGEREQIENNIMNNIDPLNNVYNPSLGF